jgi:hypothetical protein
MKRRLGMIREGLAGLERVPESIERIATLEGALGELERCVLMRLEALERRLRDRYERDASAVMRAPLEAGQITFEESRALYETTSSIAGPGPIIEVGTLFGSSTRVMALAKDQGRPLISVDVYKWNPLGLSPDSHFELTGFLLEELVRSHGLRLVRQDKDQFYRDYGGEPPALVFLDADHSYEATLADIQWAKSVGARVICGHDYNQEAFPGVCRAVDEEGGARLLVGTFWVLA